MKSRVSIGIASLAVRALTVVAGLFAIALLTQCGGAGGGRAPQPPVPQPPVPQLTIITGGLPNAVIGTPYNESVQATGGVSPFSWMVSSGTLPENLALSPSSTNQVIISGTPDVPAQGVPFTIQVRDAVGNIATQPYNVAILLQADSVVLSPANLDFGNQVIGSAGGSLTATLTNTATSDLAITSITTDGNNATEFNQTNTTCRATLAAGASCTVNLTFAPAQPGPRSAVIAISDDAAGSPQEASLSGVGLTAGANATLSILSVPFETQLVGTTSPPWPITLNNYGTMTLNIASIAVTGSFAETDNCVPSVAPGATCTIKATFTPPESGELSGTLSLTDDAAGSPQTISLNGKGATNTPPLTGYCFETCAGRSQDLADCPVGKPAETPSEAPVYPCGPIQGYVPVDDSRGCRVSATHGGRCVTQ